MEYVGCELSLFQDILITIDKVWDLLFRRTCSQYIRKPGWSGGFDLQ